MTPSARDSPPSSLCLRCVSTSLPRHLGEGIASRDDQWSRRCEARRKEVEEEQQMKASRSEHVLSDRSIEEDSSRPASFSPRYTSLQKRGTPKMVRIQCGSEDCKLSKGTSPPTSVKSFPASIHIKASGSRLSPPPSLKPSPRPLISFRYTFFHKRSRGSLSSSSSSRSGKSSEGSIESFTRALSAAIAAMCLSREWISFLFLLCLGSLLLFFFISPATATSAETFRFAFHSRPPCWLSQLRNEFAIPLASLSHLRPRSFLTLDVRDPSKRSHAARRHPLRKMWGGASTAPRELQTLQRHLGFVAPFSCLGKAHDRGAFFGSSLSATAPSSILSISRKAGDSKQFSPASDSAVSFLRFSSPLSKQDSSCEVPPLFSTSSPLSLFTSSSSFPLSFSSYPASSGSSSASTTPGVHAPSAVSSHDLSSGDSSSCFGCRDTTGPSPSSNSRQPELSSQNASRKDVSASPHLQSHITVDASCRSRKRSILSPFAFWFLLSSICSGGVWWLALRAVQALSAGARLLPHFFRRMIVTKCRLLPAGSAATDDEEALKDWLQKTAWSINTAWGKSFLSIVRCFPEIEGLEHLPPVSENVVFVANHCSHLDVAFIAAAVSRHLRFLGKVELLSVPVVGLAMRLSGCPTVDRGSPMSRLALFRETLKLLKRSEERSAKRKKENADRRASAVGLHGEEHKLTMSSPPLNTEEEGVAFVAFPEGKRSLDGRLAPFDKGGIFRLAKQAGVRVVPISVLGTQLLLPADATLPSGKPAEGSLRVVIHPPITSVDKEDVSMNKTDKIS
ncbi:acyltransferase domain-containing protein [Cystoisospora suis]|uniref:Acyltransferase domain-containing protein n=1 Tax=Cystoisospora suis TaxID=483139 RepID=A0A2C6KMH7_9APIC|nr:acyltransferase domain-containing protein [Cystoisospora suis]